MEGPLGLPRPMTDIEVSVSTDPIDVKIEFKGPMGVSRPLARPPEEREVTEQDIQECLESRAAHDFARGLSRSFTVPNDKIPQATRSWCQGILKSSTRPTNDPAEILPEEFDPEFGEIIDLEELEGETADGEEVIDVDGETVDEDTELQDPDDFPDITGSDA